MAHFNDWDRQATVERILPDCRLAAALALMKGQP